MATKRKHKGGYPPRVSGERATVQSNVKWTPREYERVRESAAAAGESISDFIRKAVQQRAKRYGVEV